MPSFFALELPEVTQEVTFIGFRTPVLWALIIGTSQNIAKRISHRIADNTLFACFPAFSCLKGNLRSNIPAFEAMKKGLSTDP